MDKCFDCALTIPDVTFSKNKNKNRKRCDTCYKERRSTYSATYRSKNTEKLRQERKQYKANNRERIAEYNRYYRSKNDSIYIQFFKKQNGKCAICFREPSGRRLAIDHDHDCCPSGKFCSKCIRGLLCTGCNTMLGLAGDSIERLRIAIEYLQHHRSV